MDIDPLKTSAAVYYVQNPDNPDKIIYWVKVYFPDHELYIGDITVRKSQKYPEKGLWFQPPTYFIKGKRTRPLEFKPSSRFGSLLRTLALEAVDKYINSRPP